ncbi:MAG: HD domain-containing phosphohydrolase [Planctomycetota bacterium]
MQLPMADAAREENPVSGANTDRCTVLVIAREPSARDRCRHTLESGGYRVAEATHDDAPAHIAEIRPDVILMEAEGSPQDATAALHRLRAEPVCQDVPLILLGPRAADGDLGFNSAADEHLDAPLEARDLLLRVRSMARLRRTRLELDRSQELRAEQARMWMVALDLSRSLAHTDSLDLILQYIVEAAAEMACSRRVALMLPDKEHRWLSLTKSVGIDDPDAERWRVPIAGSIIGRIVTAGERIVLNTLDERTAQGPRCEPDDLVSVPMVATALSTAEHTVGALAITQRHGGRPFETWELEFIDLLSNTAGTALHQHFTRQSRDEARDSIVMALATLAEYRDNDTGRHVDRVTHFCLRLAAELRASLLDNGQIDDRYLHDLRRAVPLHDIGKVAIPDSILLKPGPLTPDEIDIMRTHPTIGREAIRSVIRRTPGVTFLHMAEEIVWCHHERYDGTGYPEGVAAEAIPLSARIVAVADVYDALTSRRVYSEPQPHERAVGIIREGAGSQFDPIAVEAFLRCERDIAHLAHEMADDRGPATDPGARGDERGRSAA